MITRFAPSPTGPLHLGHAYSAILAHDMARASGGQFLLRIEDIDQTRARAQWEDQIYEDLDWLGVRWDGPVVRQSERITNYRGVLSQLLAKGLIYPCDCSRKDIAAAASAPQEGAPLLGPDGVIYPGTCATKPVDPELEPNQAYRLRIAAAFEYLGKEKLEFVETGQGPNGQTGPVSITKANMIRSVGDVVLARRDMGTSYHLSVVLDDAAQEITHVTRGADLFDATQIHVLLQHVMEVPTPIYHHHKLIRDEQGKRLAKRDDARAISKFRDDGYSPKDIRKRVGLMS